MNLYSLFFSVQTVSNREIRVTKKRTRKALRGAVVPAKTFSAGFSDADLGKRHWR